MVSSKSILNAKFKIFLLDCIFSSTFNKGSSFYNFFTADFLNFFPSTFIGVVLFSFLFFFLPPNFLS